MVSLDYLPYFRAPKNQNDYLLAKFLRRKFFPKLRQLLPNHYLLNQDPRYYLKFIRKKSKTHPFFLRFDAKRYYPSVNHKALLINLPKTYQNFTHKNPSRRLKKHLKTTLPQFLSQSPHPSHGLPIGSSLSYILAGIFLLDLDLKLKEQKIPFLRFNDDYLLFTKDKNQPNNIFENLVIPHLSKLKLSVNPAKVYSGRFHKNKLSFLGFSYFAGYFQIEPERIKKFKRKITRITYPKKRKSTKTIVKLLNNQILGFGYYYKLASAKQNFTKLDAFTRKRLRIYLVQTSQKPTLANFYLKNKDLSNLGLRFLAKIYENYQKEVNKNKKPKSKTGKKMPNKLRYYKPDLLYSAKEKQLFEILEEIARKQGKNEKRLERIEKKLEKIKNLK